MMAAMTHKGLKAVIGATERIVGRRRLAKVARLLTSEVRLDGDNIIGENGEDIVQRVALGFDSPVVFDVGSHFGEWSLSLLSQPGNRPVLHAFEPSAYSTSHASVALGDRAQVHQVALSDHSGTMELLIVHEGAGSNSLVPFTDTHRPSGEREQVTVITLDDFCLEQAIDRVTLLKIDAEGHDLAVIKGAQRMLKTQAIQMVQFEYNSRWIDARTFLLDAFEVLQGHGYRMGKATPRGIEMYPQWHPELESFREGNYLAYLPAVETKLPTIPWWGG